MFPLTILAKLKGKYAFFMAVSQNRNGGGCSSHFQIQTFTAYDYIYE
jgi:hypothetical protein